MVIRLHKALVSLQLSLALSSVAHSEHRIAYLTTISINLQAQFNLDILDSKTAASSAMPVRELPC